ncbi:MAG: YoaK family protein [Ruminococcus sp.]|jgi:uncharacterized membrane protein YoaK (UPF0700 family)
MNTLQSGTEKTEEYLECEKWFVFILMMMVGGYLGAFTYSIRGGVFCNAQTGNFVLLAMALGNGNWFHALYYIIPISAYCLGAFISEAAASRIKRFNLLRWDTVLIIIEILVILFLGFLPENAPVQITQVLINLICSMQYNTFRQAEGIPMATTFCTNHIRQVGIAICKAFRHRNEKSSYIHRMLIHLGMLGTFVLGGVISTVLCNILLGKAIWIALIPLAVVLADLLYADLKREKGKLDQIPHGH